MPSCSSLERDDSLRFLLPQGVGDTEEVERYQPGGFHPVHLGDRFDGNRYRVVHKLGAGGVSAVWLAHDENDGKWVALKIVDAAHSKSTGEKSALSLSILHAGETERVAVHQRQFTFEGPNGKHLCLVLPVLGPSLSELSYCFNSRLRPWLAQKAAYQATEAILRLHAKGLCHGGMLASLL